jgi:hypothetical protein
MRTSYACEAFTDAVVVCCVQISLFTHAQTQTMSRSLPSPPPSRAVSIAPRSDIPHYVIDLDLPPADRWREIIQQYRPYWTQMIEEMWHEFEDLHGEHFESEGSFEQPIPVEPIAAAVVTQTSISATKAKKRKKPPKLTAAQKAALAAAKHAEHVAFATKLASQLMVAFRAQGLAAYAEELESVAKAAGIGLHELVLLNLSYEAHGGCTTILAPTSSGAVLMGRTLDWQQPMLKDLTIELSFQRNGKLLYRATSFAGFLGIFTGHKPNAYAVAVNFRCADDEEEEEENEADEEDQEGNEGNESSKRDRVESFESPLPEFSWPVGFLVRHTLESCEGYDEAIDRLHRCALMSQVYFIVCGTRTEQACIITRDPEASVKPIRMRLPEGLRSKESADVEMEDASHNAAASSHKKSKGDTHNSNVPAAASSSAAAASSTAAFNTSAIGASPSSIPPTTVSTSPWLVQANMDCWLTARRLDHQESLPRTKLVNQTMKSILANGAASVGSASMTESHMWQLMSLDPIWDEETIYATVSIPAQDRFVTFIQNPHPPQQQKGKQKGGKRNRRR